MIKTGIILLFFIASCHTGGYEKKVVTRKDITGLYPEMFRLYFYKHNNRISFSSEVSDLPAKNIFRQLTRDYKLYIDYLHINYTTIDVGQMKQMVALYPDTTSAARFYINLLQQDTLFNRYMLELAGNYLRQKNGIISDVQLPAKRNYSGEELIDIATAFFYPSRYDTISKTVDWYMCVGKNPFHDNKAERVNPAAEAFCFMTLMHKTNRKKDYHREFVSNTKNIKIDLQTFPGTKDKLAALHKEMRERMSKSTSLKKALQQMYKKSKEVLPFVVTDW